MSRVRIPSLAPISTPAIYEGFLPFRRARQGWISCSEQHSKNPFQASGSLGIAATFGNVKTSVRKTNVRGERRWCVDGTVGGRRKREFFKTKAEADTACADREAQRAKAGDAWLALSSAERGELIDLYLAARKSGITIRDALAAAKSPNALPAVTIGEAVTECLAAKKAAGRRDRYIAELKRCLTVFTAGREQEPIATFAVGDVESWVNQLSGWGRATRLSRLHTLFSFALRRGYVLDNPCRRLDKPTLEQPPPAILSVDQCRELMGYVRERLPRGLAWFTLALFAGIRPEECDRLQWSAVNLDARTVTVDAAASKVRQRRIVHLMPAAALWLALAQKSGSDLPLPQMTRRRYLRAVRDHLGLARWPQDVLRHTCASHWLAAWQDAGKVANELGNSAGVLLTHYRELVPRAESERFWAILPEK